MRAPGRISKQQARNAWALLRGIGIAHHSAAYYGSTEQGRPHRCDLCGELILWSDMACEGGPCFFFSSPEDWLYGKGSRDQLADAYGLNKILLCTSKEIP